MDSHHSVLRYPPSLLILRFEYQFSPIRKFSNLRLHLMEVSDLGDIAILNPGVLHSPKSSMCNRLPKTFHHPSQPRMCDLQQRIAIRSYSPLLTLLRRKNSQHNFYILARGLEVVSRDHHSPQHRHIRIPNASGRGADWG
jgi:hypothetical protein